MKPQLDLKVPRIAAALVGVPGFGITALFTDWYYGLEHMGLIFMLRIFRNQWFWLVPIFTLVSICLGFFCYHMRMSKDSRNLWMRLWEVSLLLLVLIHCLHAYQVVDEIDVATIREKPRDGRLHSSKRLLRKSIKAFAKKVAISVLREMTEYPLSAILFVAEREILAAFLFGIVPVSSAFGALIFAATNRAKFLESVANKNRLTERVPLMPSPLSKCSV